jgi:ubiquinone/menaquinone biosynthesis C-methylase UbiE
MNKIFENILMLPKKTKVFGSIFSTIDEKEISTESLIQQKHYDKVYEQYSCALKLPQTQEYMKYMDTKFLNLTQVNSNGSILEICCGEGEALKLIEKVKCYVGIDISIKMLEKAVQLHQERDNIIFLHADALDLPILENSVDTVIILGGIHHVPNRVQLFQECFRVLKPGGKFIFREPASDWFFWKFLRKIIYRLSPGLDHQTERPLTYSETVPLLNQIGFKNVIYQNYTFIGFCLFMNADILRFNTIFKYIPGIRGFVRWVAKFDEYITENKFFKNIGLQVIGIAKK